MLERVPIRWRLAGTTAILTFAILCTFALVVGELTQSRIRSDFEHDVAAGVINLRDDISIRIENDSLVKPSQSMLDLYAGSGHAVIRLLTQDGRVLRTTKDAPPLTGADPFVQTQEVNGYRVETRPVQLQPAGIVLVQYARRVSDMESTLERVRLFLIFGVLGGTALALLAGLAIAQRAMSPIADLTARAEEIRRTRDPGRSVPGAARRRRDRRAGADAGPHAARAGRQPARDRGGPDRASASSSPTPPTSCARR